MSTITQEQIAQQFVDERLPERSVLGYGFGDFANNLAFTPSTAFLLYYYTDVAGLTAASVATMFFIVRLWGRRRRHVRRPPRRPHDDADGQVPSVHPLRRGAAPFLSFLTFHVPSALDDGAKLLYAYLTYAVLGLAYSLVNIPYAALPPRP